MKPNFRIEQLERRCELIANKLMALYEESGQECSPNLKATLEKLHSCYAPEEEQSQENVSQENTTAESESKAENQELQTSEDPAENEQQEHATVEGESEDPAETEQQEHASVEGEASADHIVDANKMMQEGETEDVAPKKGGRGRKKATEEEV